LRRRFGRVQALSLHGLPDGWQDTCVRKRKRRHFAAFFGYAFCLNQWNKDTDFFLKNLKVQTGSIITAFQQLHHIFLVWLTGIGAGAGIRDGIDCTMDNMDAVVRKRSAGFMRHGMDNT